MACCAAEPRAVRFLITGQRPGHSERDGWTAPRVSPAVDCSLARVRRDKSWTAWPGCRRGWRLAHRGFHDAADFQVLLRCDALEVAENAEHGFAMLVVDGRYDSGDEVVLKFEDRFHVERAFVDLGSELSAGRRVYELNGDAELGAGCLPSHSVRPVPCQLCGRLRLVLRISESRCGKSRGGRRSAKVRLRFLPRVLPERREFGARAGGLEWQHGYPEAFVRTALAGRACRNRCRAIDLESRFPPAVSQMVDQFGI